MPRSIASGGVAFLVFRTAPLVRLVRTHRARRRRPQLRTPPRRPHRDRPRQRHRPRAHLKGGGSLAQAGWVIRAQSLVHGSSPAVISAAAHVFCAKSRAAHALLTVATEQRSHDAMADARNKHFVPASWRVCHETLASPRHLSACCFVRASARNLRRSMGATMCTRGPSSRPSKLRLQPPRRACSSVMTAGGLR